LGPAFFGYNEGIPRLLVEVGFQDGQMRNVRPSLITVQAVNTELIVQLAHAVRRPLDLYEDRGRGRKEGLHVSHFDVKGDDAATSFFQKFESSLFGSAELARRKDREMSRHMGDDRMELSAEFFHELPDRVVEVGHQCVP